MKYKTLFRLGIKAIGLLQFAIGLSQTTMMITWAIEAVSANRGLSGVYSQIVGSVVPLAVGVYLFFGGKWIVNLAIPSNRPYCPECAYDLTGAAEPRCPECGTAFRWEDVRPKCEVQSPKFGEKQ